MENTIENAREFFKQHPELSAVAHMPVYGPYLTAMVDYAAAYAASLSPDVNKGDQGEVWTITPLEWYDHKNEDEYRAQTILGSYGIKRSITNRGYVIAKPFDVFMPPAFDTIEEAKAAAEQDYIKRLAPALTPAGGAREGEKNNQA